MRLIAGAVSVVLFCCGLFVLAQAQQGQPVGPNAPTAAWTSYSPVITCNTGAVGTYSRQHGSYEQIGKLTIFQADVQAAIGTCSGGIKVSLPVTAVTTQQQVVGAADATTFIPLEGTIFTAAASVVSLATATGSNPTGSDNFVVGGVYQTP